MAGRRLTVAVGLALSLLSPAMAEEPLVAVEIGGTVEWDACIAFGEVVGLAGESVDTLPVRAAPADDAAEIDRLAEGDGVFMCDERGDWLGIVYYPPGELKSCGVGSVIVERVAYAGSCRSGWVPAHLITLVAG
jgi:hypothetical protein